jgi:hypothetical protein
VGPVKNGYPAIEKHPKAGTSAFLQHRSESQQEGFDISPPDIGGGRLDIEGLQNPAVFALHNYMISFYSIMSIPLDKEPEFLI